MRPEVAPDKYTSPNTLAEELDSIFGENWIFACSSEEISSHEDFVCMELGGVPIVIQNFNGQLKAFENVCSHRFSRIQVTPRGNRPLKCPYHGWTYNSEGLPHIVPRRPTITELTPATLCDFRLTRWAVYQFGKLVFIKKKDPATPAIEEDFKGQWGAFFEPVSRMVASLGEVVENTHHTVKANWKLIVENTLEGYHVDCVHPESIRKLGMGSLRKNTPTGDHAAAPENSMPEGSRFEFSENNSAVFSSLNPSVSQRMDQAYKFLANRPVKNSGYQHFYFFPNFVIASTRGESFSLQRILPVDAHNSLLSSYLFATDGLGPLTKMEEALKRQFYKSAGEFVQQIFSEDAAICEQVQRSIAFARGKGVLSDEEERVCAFHRAYRGASVAGSDAMR